MRRAYVLLMLLLFVSCSASRSDTSPVASPTTDELQWIDTLRELDEQADALLAAAKFDSLGKPLSDFADRASRDHFERSEDVKAWRSAAFAAAPQLIVLPPCAEGGFRSSPGAAAPEVIERLIAHRECALAYARQASPNVRSATGPRVIAETIRAYGRDLEQLLSLRKSWR